MASPSDKKGQCRGSYGHVPFLICTINVQGAEKSCLGMTIMLKIDPALFVIVFRMFNGSL